MLLFLGSPSGFAVQSVSQVSAKRLQIWLRRHHAYMAPIIWYGGCSYTHCNCHKCPAACNGCSNRQQQQEADSHRYPKRAGGKKKKTPPNSVALCWGNKIPQLAGKLTGYKNEKMKTDYKQCCQKKVEAAEKLLMYHWQVAQLWQKEREREFSPFKHNLLNQRKAARCADSDVDESNWNWWTR